MVRATNQAFERGEKQMGLMDNIKNAQEMAKQAQQNAGQAGGMSAGMPDAGDMAYAQLAQKVAANGLPGVATIKSIGETGKADGVNKQYAIECATELEAGDSYDTTVLQNLTADAIGSGHYAEGKRFEVKVDPDDKSQALLFGLAD
ncbi:hypothetical protein BH20ACT15_BH20ACT15_14250 [soil metagenome]